MKTREEDRGLCNSQIVVILILAVMMFGCASSMITYPDAPFDAKANDLVLKAGTFETESNKYNADFGTLVVPENRNKVDARLIKLPVIRIHASGNKPAEPIFRLTGGPGLSNMKWRPSDSLLSNHDVVLVGYRGVDGSSVLDCPEVEKALKGEGGDLLGEKTLRNIAEAWTDCASRLIKEGIDIDGYTMMEVIEDMESARTALGYERIDLYSVSYGTRVAYLYALKHPDRIYRSVMIGVNPPGHMVWEPGRIDAQLQYYADLWARDSVMSARTPDLLATMRNVAHNMPRRWLFFNINPGKVRTTTFLLLYHRNTSALVFDAYVAAEKGDPSGLALMSMAYNFTAPSAMTWGDLLSKGVSADFDSSRDYFTEMDPPDAIIGSPMGKLLWGPVRFGFWPVKPIPEEFRKLQPSDVQTLLISGSIDFASPAEAATKELLPYLTRGKQVILSEMGHIDDVWSVRPEATQRLMTSFFNTGIPDTSLCTYVPMDFNVGWSFQKIAKVGFGIAAGGAAIIVGGLAWLVLR